MGRDYDAAVLVAGTCGFGMGATPNAMANMQAICDRYVPSVKAYLLISPDRKFICGFYQQPCNYLFYQYFVIGSDNENVLEKIKEKGS